MSNYISLLSGIFSASEALFRVEPPWEEFDRACDATRLPKIIRKSGKRSHRPTLDASNRLMACFAEATVRRDCTPIHKIIASARRLSEFTRCGETTWTFLGAPSLSAK